jgi:DNA-binding Xre family transcriptional regulator
MKTLDDKIAALCPERREKVLAHGQALYGEEMTLRQLRQALNITQNELADRLETAQNNVSRMERRNDMKLSTLEGYVEALGGSLKLVASFPDKGDIQLHSATQS